MISVECNKKIIPILKSNLENNISNYIIIENGCGSKTSIGEVIMPDYSTDNIGMAQIKIVRKKSDVSVNIKTLDSIIETINEDYKNIGMIKIDVEGMELDVLKGAKEILLKQRPHLFIEAKNNLEFQKIYNYLIKFKYIPMSVWAKTPVYHFVYKPSLILKIYLKYLTMNTKNEIQL